MRHIYLLEDNPLLAVDIEMCVEEMGERVLDIFAKGEDAIHTLKDKRVDLLLCDIQLAGNLTGLDVGKWATDRGIPVIFITSFSDEATFQKAKAIGPYAYITKPFNATHLRRTIVLAEQSLTRPLPNPASPAVEKALFLKHKGVLHKVLVHDIIYVESSGNYITLHLNDTRITTKRSLTHIMDVLPAESFMRIHRSFIVKLDAIQDIHIDKQTLSLSGNVSLPVGRSYKQAVLARLDINR